MTNRKHLDLGCGSRPRNPYGADVVYGLDIVAGSGSENQLIADLNVEKIPAHDNSFSSVSAYDFFEHILPVSIHEGKTEFPFVKLMNEIYRVLEPNGLLLALTPVFPAESVFVDPTHVNPVTKNTHKYFCEPDSWARMYGFNGRFKVVQVKRVKFASYMSTATGLRATIRDGIDTLLTHRRKQHILWEFKAEK